jgi:hypothetical protein
MKKTAFSILDVLRDSGPANQSDISHRIFRKYYRTESTSLISIESRKLVKKGLLEKVEGRDSLGRPTVLYRISDFGKIVFDIYNIFLSRWFDCSFSGVHWKWLSLGNRPAMKKMFQRHTASLSEMNRYVQGTLSPSRRESIPLHYSPGRFEVGLRVSSFSRQIQNQIKYVDITESSLDLAECFKSGKVTFGFMTQGALEGVMEQDAAVERELIPIWIGSRESEAVLITKHGQNEEREFNTHTAESGGLNIYYTASKDRAMWASEVANQLRGASFEIEGTTEELVKGFLDGDFESIVSISPGTELLLRNTSNIKVIRRGSEPLIGLVSKQVYQEYPNSVIEILNLMSSTSFRGPDWKIYRLADYLIHFPDLFPSLRRFDPRLRETILEVGNRS